MIHMTNDIVGARLIGLYDNAGERWSKIDDCGFELEVVFLLESMYCCLQ
jgi:hypothetical protein